MTRLFFIGWIALLAVCSYAKTTITPATPAKKNDCYQISNADELYGFAAIVNGDSATTGDYFVCGELTADIVVNEGVLTEDDTLNVADTANFVPWTPIKNFGGVFDGKGHTISGLYFNDDNAGSVGLFGTLLVVMKGMDPAVIRNVGIVGSFIRGHANVGAIVGLLMASSDLEKSYVIENCFNSSRIEAETQAGGIAGFMGGLIKIKGCWNSGTIFTTGFAGGIIGEISYSSQGGITASIENSFNTGKVIATYAGGIISDAYERVRLMNCYNLGNVVGRTLAGGIVSIFNYVCDSRIVNVYNAGKVEKLDASSQSASLLPKPIVANFTDACINENMDYLPENAFFLDTSVPDMPLSDIIGISISAELFKNGTAAYLLRNYYYEGLDASVWGQRIGTDDYPDFSGSIKGTLSLNLGTLTLHTYDGDTATLPQKYVPGYAFRLPPANRDGHLFRGWFDNEGLTGDSVVFVPKTATGEQEFWAKFEDIYKITLETDGYLLDSGNVIFYIKGQEVVLPDSIKRDGYIFLGWYADEDFSGDRIRTIAATETGNKVFYAKWFKKQMPLQDSEDCYVISNAEELYGFAAIVNGTDGFTEEKRVCAILADDIVVNEGVLNENGTLNETDKERFIPWEPIQNFEGVFDGDMHSISGLYYNDTTYENRSDCVGFFGCLSTWKEDDPVVIKNVGIEDSYFASSGKVGAFVGQVTCSYRSSFCYINIQNSYNTSTVKNAFSNGRTGGIVGIVGTSTNLTIKNAYNTGLIFSEGSDAGGLVGEIETGSTLKVVNSYNTGKVVGKNSSADNYRLFGTVASDLKVENTYFVEYFSMLPLEGSMATRDQFRDGTVAVALHGGSNGGIWGQNVGADSLPNFSGKVKNSTATAYNLTFRTFEGDTAVYPDKYAAGLERVLPDTAKREGYHFTGWYTDSTFTDSAVTSIDEDATGDKVFYAQWEIVKVSVRWTSNRITWGAVEGVNDNGIYNYGDTVYAEAVPEEGYKFNYWMNDSYSENPVAIFQATADTVIRANFIVKPASSSSSSKPNSSSSAKSSSSSPKSSSSSVVPKSSSSKGQSSSSAKSSSSNKSGNKSSSSKARSSSSCEGENCKKPENFEFTPRICTGKDCKDALPEYGLMSRFGVTVASHLIHVYGAVPGKVYALFDIQGKALEFGRVATPNFTVKVNLPGVYLLRIGGETRKIAVK